MECQEVKITKAEITAITNVRDDLHAMLGTSEPEFDDMCRKNIKAIDRFLKHINKPLNGKQ